MIIRLFLAIVVIVTIYYLYNKFNRLPSNEKRTFIIQHLFYGVIAMLLLAVIAGKLHWLGGVLAAVLGVAKLGFGSFMRAMPFINMLRKNQSFGSPRFRTEHLEIQIDLNSGEISGTVVKGPLKDSSLSSLNIEQLQELESYYQQHDKRAYYLIRVILQRADAGHQYQSNDNNFSSAGDPSVDEARLILGLSAQPNKKDIVASHRRLIQKLHPDRGGNDYLAARINLAKKVLLDHLKHSN